MQVMMMIFFLFRKEPLSTLSSKHEGPVMISILIMISEKSQMFRDK